MTRKVIQIAAAGHENVSTTASYDRRDRVAEDAAVDGLPGVLGQKNNKERK